MSLTDIVRTVNKLPDKFDDVYVSILGNRLNVLSGFIAWYGIAFAIVGSDLMREKDLMIGLPIHLLGYAATFTGLAVSLISLCGRATPHYYKRTEEHIKRFGELKPRFLEKLISKTENREFVGYCQLQGAYLAARKHGQLKVFYDVKRRCSNNIIPNF